jgi:inosine/xanthosine triphosphatase
MHIVVASKNPSKIAAVKSAFEKVFPPPITLEGVAAPSGVRDQPISDAETLAGARNRVDYIQRQHPQADFWVGVEGGINFIDQDAEAYGWMVIRSANRMGEARSASFRLPPIIAQRLRDGEELGPVNDEVFNATNSKHNGGAVGLLTNNTVTRSALYEQPLLLALIPFIHPELYPPTSKT